MSDLFGPDKDELRRLLPVREVARQLVASGCSGPYIAADGTALCPFHNDTNESFYLWDGDDGVERWWCQPCGFGGDIYDLIRRSLELSFPASVEEARRMYAAMPPDYVPPEVREKPHKPSMDEWGNSITVAQQYAARPENDGILSIRLGTVALNDPLVSAKKWDLHLRTLGWGLTPPDTASSAAGTLRGGIILIPHWDEHSKLTGCKTRIGTQKGSLPGSKYDALYGAWIGRRHKNVLLTEGESDKAWADYAAGIERIPLDVFSLPSGAKRPPLPEHIAFLQGARTIYLAFDPDDAGVYATRMWIAALQENGFGDIRICSLPYEQDLRQSQPNLKRLLSTAKAPLPDDGDVTSMAFAQGWVRPDQQGNPRQVTNWVIDPIARLSGGDDPGYDIVVHTRKAEWESVIHHADFATTRQLDKWANAEGLYYTGSDSDRKALVKHIEARASVLPEVFHTEQVGAHIPPADYHFAGESIVYPTDYKGKLPWRYAPTGKSAADVSGRVLLPLIEDTPPFEWEWLDHFLNLSDSSVMHPILAWLVAATRRHTVTNFPLLYIGGSSGVGKSTLARLACRMAGSAIEINLGSITPFVLTKTLAATTSIPIFVDEWTLLSRADTILAFQGMIPLLYTGGNSERGQADLSMTSYRMTSPTVVAGEEELNLDREIDRMVSVFPARRTQNAAALRLIETAPLEGFANVLHSFLLDEAEIHPLQYTEVGSRPEHNEMVLRAGWRILQDFLHAPSLAGEDTPDIPAEPDLSCFERVRIEREGENIYEALLQVGLPMRDQNGIPVVWPDAHGLGTWVRARELIGLIRTRRLDIKLPGGERAMLRYFSERFDVQKSQSVKPTGAQSHINASLIHGLDLQPQAEEEAFTV